MSLETPSQYEKGLEDGMRWGAKDATAKIVAWLRDKGIAADHLADAIDAGEHLE